MSNQLDREGTFKAVPVEWGIKESEGTQSVALVIDFKITAQHDGNQWVSWEAYGDQFITGYFYIIKRDGGVNTVTVESLAEAIGWDGNLASIPSGPPMTVCQITVENEEYNGKSRLKIKWINAEDFTPGRAATDPAQVAKFEAKYGGLLRATAGAILAKKKPVATSQAAPPTQETPPPLTDDDLPF